MQTALLSKLIAKDRESELVKRTGPTAAAATSADDGVSPEILKKFPEYAGLKTGTPEISAEYKRIGEQMQDSAEKYTQLKEEHAALEKEMAKNSADIKTAPSAAEKTRLEAYQDRLLQQQKRIKEGFNAIDVERLDRKFRLAALRDIRTPGTHDFLKVSSEMESSNEKIIAKSVKTSKLSPKGRWAVAGVVGALAIGGIATVAGVYGAKKAAQLEN